MPTKDKIIEIAMNNHGSVSYREVALEGIHGQYLRELVREGRLERAERGQYVLPDAMKDEMEGLQLRFGRGVFSHESALFLLEYSDRTPLRHVMTFPRKYNVTSASSVGVRTHRVDERNHGLGIRSVKTGYGHEVRAYSIERTLCDIVRPRSDVTIEIVVNAFKRYAGSSEKNPILLVEYARIFHVEDRVRSYMEALM